MSPTARLAVMICAVALLSGLPSAAPATDPRSPLSSPRAHTRAAAEATGPEIVPWIEVNRGTPDELQNAVAGLSIWRSVTRTAIVSTAPGGEHIYAHLRAALPDVAIIPGIKTYPRLKDGQFDSPAGWQQVARDVEQLALLADASHVVLEHETALRPYWRGQAQLDADRLRESVRQLPAGIHIIWYPGMVGESERNQEIAAQILIAANALGRVRFLDHSLASPKSPSSRWGQLAKARLDQIASLPSIPLVYFDGGQTYWPFQQAPAVVSRVQSAEVIVYPGAQRWVEAATVMSSALRRARPERDPR